MALSDEALLELMGSGENDRVEFKPSISDREEIKKAIGAFSNDWPDHRLPGVIVIGLHKDGRCADLSVTEELVRTVAGFRTDGSLPAITSMTVQRRQLRNCDVIVVEVDPSPSPPVRHRGRTWIRVGSTTQPATREQELRLAERSRWAAAPFDQRPVRGATLADIDIALFERVYLPNAVASEVLAENRRTTEEQLAALRLATSDGVPTYGGILVIGKDPLAWVPGAYVQFVRFDGIQMTDLIRDEKEISGPLPDVMKQLDDILGVNIQVAVKIAGSPRESRSPDYPIEALRQLVRNAVLHRAYDATNAPSRLYWYSDRVEIWNPGGPFGLVSKANFGTPGLTDYRNPQIAEAMRVLGYAQRFGWGIPASREALEKNGNPLPEFQVEAEFISVTVRRPP